MPGSGDLGGSSKGRDNRGRDNRGRDNRGREDPGSSSRREGDKKKRLMEKEDKKKRLMEEGRESGRDKRQRRADPVREQIEERSRSDFPEHRIQAEQFMDQFESRYKEADMELIARERFVNEHPNNVGESHRDGINTTIFNITRESMIAKDKGFKKIKVSMSMWYTPNNNHLEGKHGTDG